MKVFLISFAAFAVAMALMAVGVILGKRSLQGSCGGLAGLKDAQGRPACDACTTPSESCAGVGSNQTPADKTPVVKN